MALWLAAPLLSNMNVSVTEVLLFISITMLIYYFRKESRSYKFVKSFPGRKILPIIGQFLFLPPPSKLLETAVEHQIIYGTRMNLVCGPLQVLWMTHPDDVAKVLSSRDRTTDKVWLYPIIFGEWLGTSLFNTKGKEYFTRRKMLMPAFNFGILENFYSIFNRNSVVLVDLLKAKEAQKEVVEIHSLVNLCALDIIFESATGTRVNCLSKLDHEFPIAHIQEFKYLYLRAFQPWLWPKFIWRLSPTGIKEKANRKVMSDFVEKIIRQRRSELFPENKSLQPAGFDVNGNDLEEISSKGEATRKNLLDLLLHVQHKGEMKITDQDIRDEAAFFIFAGHDTTSSTLTWAVYLLAKNLAEQEKLHEELDSIFGDDRTRNVDASDLYDLKYLECCIKETLRLYPPAPFFARQIERDLKLDDKTTIPEGTDILLFPWLTHRLPEFFPEPEKFDPSRFSPENSVGRHPYAYIAFSGGPRNCMGQKYALAEVKMILAHLFRNFKVELNSPEEKVIPVPLGTVAPKNGLKIKLTLR